MNFFRITTKMINQDTENKESGYKRLTPEEKERVLNEVYEIQLTIEEFNELKRYQQSSKQSSKIDYIDKSYSVGSNF